MITYPKIVFMNAKQNHFSKIISLDSPNVNINHNKRAGRSQIISIEAFTK